MVSSVDASVVGLEGDPEHVLDGMTKMKFFFYNSGPDERYAEVFINVDAKNQVLQFHEKDPEYRKPLLLDFTKGPLYSLEGAVRRERFGAADAGGQCAPAALVRRGRPAPQLHR